MPDFKEELLQFIWRYRILKPLPLRTVSGKTLSVIKQGEINRQSGPDFFNGQIQLGDLILVGNIELHLKTSDWIRHHHQHDRAYDRIILHVVYEHDKEIEQNTLFGVEVLELKNYIDPETLKHYEALSESADDIPCKSQLSKVENIKYLTWLDRMSIERLEKKTDRIKQYFEDFRGDYSQTFYCLLVRGLGFNINAIPFEMLARQLPVHLLLKYSDDILQLEAILLGFAGMLEDQYEDAYMRQLQNIFEFKRQKYKLVPLKKEIFKFSKMRPFNFPNLRLAQLAAIIHAHPALFTSPHHFSTYQQIIDLFLVEPSAYWKQRFIPDGKLSRRAASSGKQSAENFMINTFASFFFFYGEKLNKPLYKEAALHLLGQCASENNAKTRMFESKVALHTNALNSQGLIHLHDHYCVRKKCLQCGIAAALLRAA